MTPQDAAAAAAAEADARIVEDRLSWSQALNLNTYGTEKAPVKNLAVRNLGVWRDDDETIWIIEFSPHTDTDQITIVGVKRLRFVLQI